MPDDDDRAAEPDLAIDAVEYRLVWQHANAWGGDAYADWFCHTYASIASSLVDFPPIPSPGGSSLAMWPAVCPWRTAGRSLRPKSLLSTRAGAAGHHGSPPGRGSSTSATALVYATSSAPTAGWHPASPVSGTPN